MTRRLVLPLLALALCLPLAACGDEAGTATPAASADGDRMQGTPLDENQAQLLASAQFLNFRNKGATFEMLVGEPETDASFTLRGQMDWDQLVGYAAVTPETGAPFQVWWRLDVVVESDPALSAVLAADDQPPVFVAHAPNPQANPLDKALSILLELGSKRRDNPLLVRQTPGSAYLGEEEVRGSSTLVLRYGEINRFWIDPDSGLMLRFAGDSRARKAPVAVDLLAHGAQTIVAPQGTIVDESEAVRIAARYGLADGS